MFELDGNIWRYGTIHALDNFSAWEATLVLCGLLKCVLLPEDQQALIVDTYEDRVLIID